MSYAIVLGDQFRPSLSRLNAEVQETILDDLDAMAQHADEFEAASNGTVDVRMEWHRHRGTIEGITFDVVTWIGVDAANQTLRAMLLWDLLHDTDDS